MKVKVAKNAGFCMGVRRAMDLVLNAARDRQPDEIIHTYGPLIHNNQVLEILERQSQSREKSSSKLKHRDFVESKCLEYLRQTASQLPYAKRDELKQLLEGSSSSNSRSSAQGLASSRRSGLPPRARCRRVPNGRRPLGAERRCRSSVPGRSCLL